MTIENPVFSDGANSEGCGFLQTGGSETLCNDQALRRRIFTVTKSGDINFDVILVQIDLLRSHIHGNAPKSVPGKDDKGCVIPGKARRKKQHHQETE